LSVIGRLVATFAKPASRWKRPTRPPVTPTTPPRRLRHYTED
jgi:hypothetical protein